MKKYYLTNCNIIDINTGEWLTNKAILIEGELINNIVSNQNLSAMPFTIDYSLEINGIPNPIIYIF